MLVQKMFEIGTNKCLIFNRTVPGQKMNFNYESYFGPKMLYHTVLQAKLRVVSSHSLDPKINVPEWKHLVCVVI